MIESHENYQKRSPRNRYQIINAQGVETLTIPLAKGKNNRQPIKEVQISYVENWSRKHLQAIKSAYGSAPYYEHYINDIEALLNTKKANLFGLNLASIELIMKLIGLNIPIIETTKFEGPTYSYPIYECSAYEQVFEERNGYIPTQSILDLLFCKGPESILYL